MSFVMTQGTCKSLRLKFSLLLTGFAGSRAGRGNRAGRDSSPDLVRSPVPGHNSGGGNSGGGNGGNRDSSRDSSDAGESSCVGEDRGGGAGEDSAWGGMSWAYRKQPAVSADRPWPGLLPWPAYSLLRPNQLFPGGQNNYDCNTKRIPPLLYNMLRQW